MQTPTQSKRKRLGAYNPPMQALLLSLSSIATGDEFGDVLWRTVVVGTLMFFFAGGILVAFALSLRRSGQTTRKHALVLLVSLVLVLASFSAVLAWLSYR
jgi:uncharacterized membrane protein